MRRFFVAGAVAAVAAFSVPASAGGNVLDGQRAPEVTLTAGLNGASAATTLESLRGRVVCLKFWLPRCPICRGTLPAFQALHDELSRSGVTCLSVVIENPEGIADYLKEAGWTFPVGCDPNRVSAERYGVLRYPADYVVGIDGIVRASNGFPRSVIEEELRKYRLAEWGEVPAALKGARSAVAEGDYGEALRRAESVVTTPEQVEGVKQALARLVAIATQRMDNRVARAEALAKGGDVAGARRNLERVVSDFAGTSLEARAKERLAAFNAAYPPR